VLKSGVLSSQFDLYCQQLFCAFGKDLIDDVCQNLDLRLDGVDADYAAKLEGLIQSHNDLKNRASSGVRSIQKSFSLCDPVFRFFSIYRVARVLRGPVYNIDDSLPKNYK
jgi:hypothetical protein